MITITSTPQNEFWFHVATQADIPIAGEVEKSIDVPLLGEVLCSSPTDSTEFFNFLVSKLMLKPDCLDFLRSLVGISDKRLYLELSYIFAKTCSLDNPNVNILGESFYSLDKHKTSFFQNILLRDTGSKQQHAASLIASYLCDKGLCNVVNYLKKLDINEVQILIENWILPKEVQQAEAKRRGHGAEYELVKVLSQLGVSILPLDRINHPISKDPNVDRDTFLEAPKEQGRTWSFDIIIQNHQRTPYIFVQSLIHTSDPGQYGVNKSDETLLIKNDLVRHNQKYGAQKQLWGLVDGVGFSENKRGTLDKMLNAFDCFLQMKTFYKAALALHHAGFIQLKGIMYDASLYSQQEIALIHAKYGGSVPVFRSENDAFWSNKVAAGVATVFL